MIGYQKIKTSAVDWIGNIPEHWDIRRLKRSTKLITEKASKRDNPIALENIESWTGRLIKTETEFEGDGIAFNAGDILFGKLRPYLAKAYLTDLTGEAVGDLLVLRPEKDTSSKFTQYQILNREFISIVNSSTFGSKMPRTSWDFMGNMLVTAPPIDEQEKIVNFLDRETSKIDELIQKQEKLIELIQELQQAKILMCVTRGIKPVAKLKKSTNIWLDEIPSSWGEGNLKVLSKIYSGGTPDKSKQEYWTNGTIPWLNSGSVNDFYIFEPSEYITVEALSKSSAKWIKSGSVLVALAGQGKTKGMAAQLMFDSTCNQSMCAIVPSEKLNSNYLLWWLSANYQNIRNLAGGDLRDGLNLEMIGSIKCPLPSINEQIEIAKYLDSVKEKNLHLIERCKKSIELLTEHRSSLISAAVTGKIDVREVA